METQLIWPMRRRLAQLFAIIAITLLTGVPAQAITPQRFTAAVTAAKEKMASDPGGVIAMIGTLRNDGSLRDPIQVATLDWLEGEALVRTARPERGLALLGRARAVTRARQPGGLLEADILLSQGGALTDSNRITEGLRALQRAHDLFAANGENRGRARALILIALLYSGARDYSAALRYFEQARDAYAGDTGLLVAIDNGRAGALAGLHRPAEAAHAYDQALSSARRMGSPPVLAAVLGNLADARLRAGQSVAARNALSQGFLVARDPRASAVRLALTAFAASLAFRSGDIERAAALIEHRFAGVDLARTMPGDRDAHEIAYRIYLQRGDAARALAHLTALKRLDEKATEIARSTGAALAAARFDYANQELRIAKLKADDLTKTVAFERAAARSQKFFFVGVGVATALVIALLVFVVFTLRRSRDRERAVNDDLEITNAKLATALAARTQFLATTSHEIRTPLNGILGMTQVMIADGTLDAATRDRLSVLHGAGLTMRALIDDILDVAKIESGRMTIESAPMDLHAVIDEASRMWVEAARARGLSFVVDRDAAPRWIIGDAARVRQIVFNLLSNAVKFTSRGGITLVASVAGAAGENVTGDRIHVAVSDSGIGIPDDVRESIFEAFRQADAGTTRRFGGTGLGLAICRNLSRVMGGDVTVDSVAGRGTTFTLDLPLVPAQAPDEVVRAVADVMVVAVNPISRATYATLFEPHGVVVVAADPAEALASPAPARLLIDTTALGASTMMPDRVRELVDAIGDGRVLLLCAAGDERQAGWLAAGATVVERPIAKAELVRRVFTLSPNLVLKVGEGDKDVSKDMVMDVAGLRLARS